MQPTLRIQAERALWNEKNAQTVFPNLEIVHQVCTASPWQTACAYFENLRLLEEHTSAGHRVRHIRFIEIPGANHFVSWFKQKRVYIRLSGCHRYTGTTRRHS